ncbi:MAG: hypothetical protein NT051_01705, partial [Candidatus Micrarchaeota archaeon]|nr:hypothetical protein [Candidatus Micrarchaeota archaeon]
MPPIYQDPNLKGKTQAHTQDISGQIGKLTNRSFYNGESLVQGETDLFPRTYPMRQSDRFLKKYIFALMLEKVSEQLIFANSVPTDYKVLCKPMESTGAYALFDDSLQDMLGIKVNKGVYKGKEVYYRFSRNKDKYSATEKKNTVVGGSRMIQVENYPVNFSKAIEYLEDCKSSNLDIWTATKISLFLGYLSQCKALRNDLLLEACGNSESRLGRLETLLGRFSKLAGKLEANDRAFSLSSGLKNEELLNKLRKTAKTNAEQAKKEQNKSEPENTKQVFHNVISEILSAAGKWPLQANGNGEAAAASFIRIFPESERSALLKWCDRYGRTIFPHTFGVEFLERNTSDRQSEIEAYFVLAIHNAKRGANDGQVKRIMEHQDQFDNVFHTINNIISKADSDMQHFKSMAGREPGELLGLLCEIADRRSKALYEFSKLQPDPSCLGEAYAKEMEKLLIEMAANLCRVSRAEASAWAELGDWKAWRGINDKQGKACLSSIKEFIKAANSEAALLDTIEKNASNDRASHKVEITKMRAEMIDIIGKIKNKDISPSGGAWLERTQNNSQDHISYEQGETVSQYAKNAYFNPVACLMLQKGSLDIGFYNTTMAHLVKSNAEILSSISSPELLEEIIDDISKLQFTRWRAFDLASDYDGLLKRGYTGKDLEVNYWFSVRKDANGAESNMVNLAFLNTTLQVEIPYKLPYDGDEYSPILSKDNAEAHPIERIYGRRLTLDDIIGPVGEGESLGSIYKRLYKRGYGKSEFFNDVLSDLANGNMDNARYLSTYDIQTYQSGSVSSAFGECKPRILDADPASSDDMRGRLKAEYPSYSQ